MEIFIELTRRCDMACTHCLRGDAQGKDMNILTMHAIFDTFESVITSFGFGGGEAILKPDLLNVFTQEFSWSPAGRGTYGLDPIWIVTNGKRLTQQEHPVLEYNAPKYWDEENEEEPPDNTPIVDAILRLSKQMPINLAISTDTWHNEQKDGAERRFDQITEMFENEPEITVLKHGPDKNGNLINMGRTGFYQGIELHIDQEQLDTYYYVNIHGEVWVDCNLSYTFMDQFKDTSLCLGNVHINTLEEIQKAARRLQKIMDMGEDGGFNVAETHTGSLEELETLYIAEYEKICETCAG